MKNIYCIVGPSGSGKTTLAQLLKQEYGFRLLESYTTRPKRFPEETGYHFVSPEEFQSIGEIYAYNEYNGNLYGISADSLKDADLLIVDPFGAEDLINRYHGKKSIKVIGIKCDADILIDRMKLRGDSEKKIISRLIEDAETFKNMSHITDITLDSDETPKDLCEIVKWHIDSFEYWAQHEYSLLNEHGEIICTKRCNSMTEALEGIYKSYPDGLKEGWSVRDETNILKEDYRNAIKKLKPNWKSSMIEIDISNAGTSSNGYTAVSFTYQNKKYFYRSYMGESWINKDTYNNLMYTALDDLNYKLEKTKKKIEKIASVLETTVDSEHKFSLEASYRNKQEAKIILEKALVQLIKEKMQNKIPASLDDVISDAKHKSSQTISFNERIDSNTLFR